jgi:hypothetical protein
LLSAALLNPSLVHEEREPLPSVAAVILDRSESMQFGDRTKAAEAAYAALTARLAEDKTLEVRTLETSPGDDGTYLQGALEGLMADVPRDRIAGAVFITDGQIHDLPDPELVETLIGPLHGLIAGDEASYRYLAESIRMHPDQATLKAMMVGAGFGHVDVHNLAGGIVALHVGIKC